MKKILTAFFLVCLSLSALSAKIKYPEETYTVKLHEVINKANFEKKPIMFIVSHQSREDEYKWIENATNELIDLVDQDKFLFYSLEYFQKTRWDLPDWIHWAADRPYPSLIIMSPKNKDLIYAVNYNEYKADPIGTRKQLKELEKFPTKPVKMKKMEVPKGVYKFNEMKKARDHALKENKHIAYLNIPEEIPETVHWHTQTLNFFFDELKDEFVIIAVPPSHSNNRNLPYNLGYYLIRSFPSLIIANNKGVKYGEIDQFAFEWKGEKNARKIILKTQEQKNK